MILFPFLLPGPPPQSSSPHHHHRFCRDPPPLRRFLSDPPPLPPPHHSIITIVSTMILLLLVLLSSPTPAIAVTSTTVCGTLQPGTNRRDVPCFRSAVLSANGGDSGRPSEGRPPATLAIRTNPEKGVAAYRVAAHWPPRDYRLLSNAGLIGHKSVHVSRSGRYRG